MKASQHQLFRRRLEELLAHLEPQTRAIGEQALQPSGGQGLTDLSNAPMHLGDTGSEEYVHELNATLMENEEYLLAETRSALSRLDNGTYGRCERCGTEIAPERLKALPYARLCVHCAAEADDASPVNLNVGRPRSPADTLADEEEMEIKRRDEKTAMTDMFSQRGTGMKDEFARRNSTRRGEADAHAVGTPGGGSAIGGLAGTNKGDGVPDIHELQEAMGTSSLDAARDEKNTDATPVADRTGKAIEGTPVTRR